MSGVLLPMDPRYMGTWLVLLAAILAADYMAAMPWVWGIIIATFLLVEGLAVRRHLHGDTFSELMWTFRHVSFQTAGNCRNPSK